MTTYVILSRVRRANTILILRAFSLRLFQQGCPPGPFCLLKLLRARFAAQIGDDDYTPEKAQAEYHAMVKTWVTLRNEGKHAELRWKCFSCEKMYPAEGFNASSDKKKEMSELCIRPGYWKACIACTASVSLWNPRCRDSARNCVSCGTKRGVNWFEGLDTECRVCTLRADFGDETDEHCQKCNAIVKKRARTSKLPIDKPTLCGACTELKNTTCSICKETKPASQFSQYAKRSTAITRCHACSIACSKCKTACANVR